MGVVFGEESVLAIAFGIGEKFKLACANGEPFRFQRLFEGDGKAEGGDWLR